jgi:hypothetical protein
MTPTVNILPLHERLVRLLEERGVAGAEAVAMLILDEIRSPSEGMVIAGINGAGGHVVWRYPGDADLAVLDMYATMIDAERIDAVADRMTPG